MKCSVAIILFINIIIADNRPLNSAPLHSLRPIQKQLYSPMKMSSYYGKNVLTHHDGAYEYKPPLSKNVYVSYENHITEPEKKCAILLMSNQGEIPQQSLLRKYRYDAKGTLIPSSVQYYIKRGEGGSHALVRLDHKYVSPGGGFLKYYKEVPPIMPYNSLK